MLVTHVEFDPPINDPNGRREHGAFSITISGQATSEMEDEACTVLSQCLGGPISLGQLTAILREMEERWEKGKLPESTQRILVTAQIPGQPVAHRVVIEPGAREEITLGAYIGLAPISGRVERFPVHIPLHLTATVLP